MEEYLRVWVGTTLNFILPTSSHNEYFGLEPFETKEGGLNEVGLDREGVIPLLKERINLNEEKSIELILQVKS